MITRREPNLFAAGCAIAFLLCYLFLPFYSVLGVPLNGWALLQGINAVMCIPLVFALLMIAAPLLFDVKISLGIGAASLTTLLILLLCGREIILGGNALSSSLAYIGNDVFGFNIASVLPVSAGAGCILSMVLCIGYVVIEVLISSQRRTVPSSDPNPFPF